MLFFGNFLNCYVCYQVGFSVLKVYMNREFVEFFFDFLGNVIYQMFLYLLIWLMFFVIW